MTKLLEVKDLKKYYNIDISLFKKGIVKAVDGVSFYVNEGETLGLVGESGCGKSTTGLSLLRLIEPSGGEVLFEGENICDYNQKSLRNFRSKMQIVFQDPYASLNPRWKISKTIEEALEIHKKYSKKDKEKAVEELLTKVGIDPSYKDRYPHEFSGGQRQRVGIARALAVNPKIIVCDEPVSALDVSVQAQIINLLKDLQDELNLSFLFIAHDLGVVRQMCDRVAVMYLGKIVEMVDTENLFENAKHPYTKALLSAIPNPDPLKTNNEIILEGELPSPLNPPVGCSFGPRCRHKVSKCSSIKPELRLVEGNHYVACHLLDKKGKEGVQ